MVSKTIAVIFGVMLLAVACGSDDQGARQDEVGSDVSEEADTPNEAPVISSGPVATGSVEIDGVVIDYATSVPDGFTVGDEAPVLLAFPPGGQDLGLTRTIVKNTYAPEAQRLGWVVVSPAAPNGELYFQGSEVLIPGFLDWVESWVTPEGGAPHVAGISNGGISSFRYAAENPDRVQSIVTFPGFPRSDDDNSSLEQLTGVPIRMFVGANDIDWVGPAQETLSAFEDFGGDIELTIFPDEGHVMRSTSDGELIFEQLEGFR